MTPAAKREAVAHVCTVHEVSQRRACSILGVDRSSVRYRSVRPDDADLRKAMKDVAAERRRFGYGLHAGDPTVMHVKPHGALNNMAAVERDYAMAIGRAIERGDCKSV